MAKLDMMNSSQWYHKPSGLGDSVVGNSYNSGGSSGVNGQVNGGPRHSVSVISRNSISGGSNSSPTSSGPVGSSPICYNYTHGAPVGGDVINQISEICDGLYLCGARAVKVARIRELGITCIFNVTIELPSLLIDKIDYVKIAIDDSPYTNISYYWDRVADKIEEVRRRGGNTLVHCVAGVSRSASCCIAYLIKYKRMSLRKAYQHVKIRRHCVRPNPGFFRQLCEFEMKHLGASSVSMIWSTAAGCHIPDVYESEYNNTMNFLNKYGPAALREKQCSSWERHRY